MITVHEKLKELLEWFKKKDGVIVAFSGGVDSSVVAVAASYALGNRAIAVTADSPLLPPGELEEAKKIAELKKLRHIVIKVNQLENENLVKNPPNRCYFCKKELISTLKKIAKEFNISTIVDGTNYDDLNLHRPGYIALKEEGVESPLAELKITKKEVREIARILNLPNSDKPSMACLASRFPYGQSITLNKILRVSEAEEFIKRKVNVTQIRVRDHGNIARIEVLPEERKFFFDERIMDEIANKLKELGYTYITLDLQGYRTGSMDEVLEKRIVPSNIVSN